MKYMPATMTRRPKYTAYVAVFSSKIFIFGIFGALGEFGEYLDAKPNKTDNLSTILTKIQGMYNITFTMRRNNGLF